MEFAKWIAVKHFFSSQGLRAVGDWTRQSFGIFSNFKQLRCSWGGRKARQHKELHSWKLAAAAQKSRSTFHLAPEELCPYDGIQLLMALCEWTGAHWTEDKAHVNCAMVSGQSACHPRAGEEKGGIVAECTPVLFAKWLIYWKAESLVTEILIPGVLYPIKGTW